MKVVQYSILYKTANGRVCLSPTGVEQETPKIAIFEIQGVSKVLQVGFQLYSGNTDEGLKKGKHMAG